jgi:hypothetical protein
VPHLLSIYAHPTPFTRAPSPPFTFLLPNPRPFKSHSPTSRALQFIGVYTNSAPIALTSYTSNFGLCPQVHLTSASDSYSPPQPSPPPTDSPLLRGRCKLRREVLLPSNMPTRSLVAVTHPLSQPRRGSILGCIFGLCGWLDYLYVWACG